MLNRTMLEAPKRDKGHPNKTLFINFHEWIGIDLVKKILWIRPMGMWFPFVEIRESNAFQSSKGLCLIFLLE